MTARLCRITIIGALALLAATFLFRQVLRNGQHDFMPFYLGAKLAASGQIAHLYDKPAYQPLISQLRNAGERMSPFDAHYFIRPAFQVYFYIPFTWFPYRQACVLILIWNFGLLGALVWKLPIWFAVEPKIRPFVRAGLAVFFPFLWSISMGQDTLLLTLLVGCAIFLESTGRDALAGFVMGLCAWKPHLIWVIPIALMAARRWRMAAACVATSSALLAVSFGAVGLSGFRQWIQIVQTPSSDIHVSEMGNIRGLDFHGGLTIASIALALTVLCLIVVLLRGAFYEKLSAAIFTALLLSPHTYWQDYSLAAVVAMLIPNPVARLVLLAPWPFLYRRTDELPMAFLALAFLMALGAKQAIHPLPVVTSRYVVEEQA